MLGALIGFVRSPVFLYAAGALAFLAFVAHQRHDAAMTARAEMKAEIEARTEEELSRQAEAFQTVLAAARERTASAENNRIELRERADGLLARLEELEAACPLDDDTIERLRRIR